MCYINIINARKEIISPNIYYILNKGTLYTFKKNLPKKFNYISYSLSTLTVS